MSTSKYILELPMTELEEYNTFNWQTQTYTKVNGEISTYRSKSKNVLNPMIDTGKWIIHHLPKDIYDSKNYPNCKCGRKYIPVKIGKKLTKKCYYCRYK